MRYFTKQFDDVYKTIALSEVFGQSVVLNRKETVVFVKIKKSVILAKSASMGNLDEKYAKKKGYPIARVRGNHNTTSIGILGTSYGLGTFFKRGTGGIKNSNQMREFHQKVWQQIVKPSGLKLELSKNDLVLKGKDEPRKISGGLFYNFGIALIGYSSLVETHPDDINPDKLLKGAYTKRVCSFEECTGKKLPTVKLPLIFKKLGVTLVPDNTLTPKEEKRLEKIYAQHTNPDWQRFGRKRWF